LIDLLIAGLRQRAEAEATRATGICADTRVQRPGSDEKTDAICVRLERTGGDAVDVYLPYRRGFFGRIKYDDLFASAGTWGVFPDQADDQRNP
jgi:hypothetical protein